MTNVRLEQLQRANAQMVREGFDWVRYCLYSLVGTMVISSLCAVAHWWVTH